MLEIRRKRIWRYLKLRIKKFLKFDINVTKYLCRINKYKVRIRAWRQFHTNYAVDRNVFLWFSHTVTSLNGVYSREKFRRNLYPTTHRGKEGELSHNAPVRFRNGGRIDGIALGLDHRYSRPPGIVPWSFSLKRKFSLI